MRYHAGYALTGRDSGCYSTQEGKNDGALEEEQKQATH